MENLTSLQAAELSGHLLTLNESIEDFLFDNIKVFSEEQKEKLCYSLDLISGYAQDILAFSTILVMDDVQASLTEIKTITEQIKTTLKTLRNIQKGVDIATSVVKLGAAITDKNPQKIIDAISGLVKIGNT